MEIESTSSLGNYKTNEIRGKHYQETLLYGMHTYAPLSKQAKEEAQRIRLEKRRKQQLKQAMQAAPESKFQRYLYEIKRKWILLSETDMGRKINDVMFLTLLGICIAFISFLIDVLISGCYMAQMSMLRSLRSVVAGQFFAWILFIVVFTCFSVGTTHLISPMAIGSGIPEIKTMLRGVLLKEYLTPRTLMSKIVGLIAALGSGLPIGKEGPFVHISAIVAAHLSRLFPAFSSELRNRESRQAEILVPASAVGLSCTFAAPVGGLLFSLESTASYFGIRNYWRAFFAGAVGALAYRMLSSWLYEENAGSALRTTSFPQDKLFSYTEFVAFTILGILAGLLGAAFILLHKYIVLFVRNNSRISAFFKLNRFIYPTLVAALIAIVQFPPWFGRFTSGELSNSGALNDLFGNFTWSRDVVNDLEEQKVLDRWSSGIPPLVTALLFSLMRVWMCALSVSIPFPCGIIFPAFAIGAGLGRFFGELMSIIFPYGIANDILIVPGGYAVVGSVAMVGAITHTFSPVVIAFELTGQMGHVLPSLMAVMIANAVSRAITESIYECIIEIKKLPYLPFDIINNSASHTKAKDIMRKNVQILTLSSTYGDAAMKLIQFPYKAFPIVDNRENMTLIGSIERSLLKQSINDQLSFLNKFEYFSRVVKELKDRDDKSPIENFDTLSMVKQWRDYELSQKIDFDRFPYDPAPLFIHREASLQKMHYLFSILNLHHIFVTDFGKLIGIISYHEIRCEIQKDVDFRDRRMFRSCIDFLRSRGSEYSEEDRKRNSL